MYIKFLKILVRLSWTLIGGSGSPLLQGYGFPVSQLFDMLLEMREQYGEILLKRWNVTFRYCRWGTLARRGANVVFNVVTECVLH